MKKNETVKRILFITLSNIGDVVLTTPTLLTLIKRYNNAKIDAHTDSCDHVALLCVKRAEEGGESGVISALALYNNILKNKPEYLEPLCKGFYIDLIGKGKSEKELSAHPIPVFSFFQGKMCSRFNKG